MEREEKLEAFLRKGVEMTARMASNDDKRNMIPVLEYIIQYAALGIVLNNEHGGIDAALQSIDRVRDVIENVIINESGGINDCFLIGIGVASESDQTEIH